MVKVSPSVSLVFCALVGLLIGRIDSDCASYSSSLAETEHILLMKPKNALAFDFFFCVGLVANSIFSGMFMSSCSAFTVDYSYCS
jgi:hypothetical protein